MRRKISILAFFILCTFALFSCSGRNVLLFLNWGEYVDEAMLEEFEKIYNCEVVMDLTDSNEKFYAKVSNGTTCYDVVSPSDYMVEKMYKNDMLSKIDLTKLEHYDLSKRMPGVVGIAEELEKRAPGITEYYVPYLWGTWGIMYSTKKEGLKEAITTAKNEWASLFDRSILPDGTRVAMYNSSLHDYYAACKYLGLPYGPELDKTDLGKIYDVVKNMRYDAWGTDDIKKDIVAGNRDLGFMWTGDFLYYYCENAANVVMDAYLAGDVTVEEIPQMLQVITQDNGIYKDQYEIGFDIFIPKDTIAFCDNLIIPKDAAHYDLALKFIDFMCSRTAGEDEVDPAYANTYYVSYNTPFVDVYADILDLKNLTFTKENKLEFDSECASGTNAYDTTLYWNAYDIAIGIAFEKYYPKEEKVVNPDGSTQNYKGCVLAAFSRHYIDTINTTFNNARASR